MTLKVVIRTASRLLLVSIGVGTLLITTPPLALGQPAGAPNREAIRSLNLSRSQMRQLRSIVQGYQSSLEGILTSSQRQQLEDLQAAQLDQPASDSPPDLVAQLNLSADQQSQLETIQASMAEELKTVLSPEQFEQAQQLGFPGL
ncbi:hypothetical protein IQ254_30455 [Nodosilinea sp. LEGE 07088]|uniref:Spy/CpxP family protein refolding chaperone n=1 Tax=Nodosilinea sp. LEGE 07088 TaxID=2777968 RepID=UPI0018811CF9|nr:hypothetical protein [Nodosilinea sp. LEGE 07088]MBE9141462.1 hypothetical protein [Nodosilinea sp. LEGE 07088]